MSFFKEKASSIFGFSKGTVNEVFTDVKKEVAENGLDLDLVKKGFSDSKNKAGEVFSAVKNEYENLDPEVKKEIKGEVKNLVKEGIKNLF